MSLTLFHRHALDDQLSGLGAAVNPHHLSVIRRPAIFSVLAHRGYAAGLRQVLAAIDGVSIRDCAPGEWLAVSTLSATAVIENALAAVGGASVLDQSEGRVLLQLSGPNARKILAKCVAADLHPEAFAVGRSANMLCCHVAINLARTADDVFEIIAPRSFCGSLFTELMEMGREFALTAGFADR